MRISKRTRLGLVVLAVSVALALGIGCCYFQPFRSTRPVPRRNPWATPIAKPGLPNLYRVSDTLYRSAQPTAEGMKQLEEMGIKTVVNLRQHHSDDDLLTGLGLEGEHIESSAMGMTTEQVVRFLRIATDKTRGPLLVHCKHGADRTGVMCAAYRIVVEGWTKSEALDEMVEGDFGHHAIWGNLRRFVDKLDVDDVKRRAGLN